MSISGWFFAATYDRMLGRTEKAGLGAWRTDILGGAAGDVLEIGGGTGLNLPHYGPEVRSLTITEPEKPMAKRLERRVVETEVHATVLRAPAEDLPFEDDSFDVAVSTLVLCTVDDQPRALRELRRVLRPGGRLLFIEHIRSDDPKVAKLQDRILPLNVRVAHGCHCNRPTVDGIRAAGFEVARLERDELHHAPPFVRPLAVGVATSDARRGPVPDGSEAMGMAQSA